MYCEQIPSRFLRSERFKLAIWAQGRDWLHALDIYQLQMTLESDVTLFSLELDAARIMDAFKFEESWPINMTLAGTYTRAGGFDWILNATKYERRKNMRGKMISVGVAVSCTAMGRHAET